MQIASSGIALAAMPNLIHRLRLLSSSMSFAAAPTLLWRWRDGEWRWLRLARCRASSISADGFSGESTQNSPRRPAKLPTPGSPSLWDPNRAKALDLDGGEVQTTVV